MRSEQIASSASTNPAVIRKLFSMLARAGLTSAQLGAGGGATLNKLPREIRLLDVYRAVEDTGLFCMHRCQPDQSCFVGKKIQQVLEPHFSRAQHAMERELSKTTLADIVRQVERG